MLTANNVYISDNSHGYEDVSRPIMQQPVVFKGPVSIGEGSWIGENVIIGADIRRNCDRRELCSHARSTGLRRGSWSSGKSDRAIRSSSRCWIRNLAETQVAQTDN